MPSRIGALVNEQGAWANIPHKTQSPAAHLLHPCLYRARNCVERFFNKIKHCRRIATRYDKLAVNLPGVCLGGALARSFAKQPEHSKAHQRHARGSEER